MLQWIDVRAGHPGPAPSPYFTQASLCKAGAEGATHSPWPEQRHAKQGVQAAGSRAGPKVGHGMEVLLSTQV